MAAPNKQGLDYFPFDVDLLDDEALDILREEHGCVINDVYIALLCLAYKKRGYYVEYGDEKEKQDCHWYIFKKIRGGKYPVQLKAIPEMIEYLRTGQLISADCECKIITSERIQETYYRATVDRKVVDINPKYWLLSAERMRRLSKSHPYYLSLQLSSKSGDLPSKSGDLPSKSGEKPLKESKVNSNIDNLLEEKECREKAETANADTRKASFEEITRKSDFNQALKNFVAEFDIQVDNYTARLADMDFDLISQAYRESKNYLQKENQAKFLSWICKNYGKIIGGYFKDRPKPKETPHEEFGGFGEIYARLEAEERNGVNVHGSG